MRVDGQERSKSHRLVEGERVEADALEQAVVDPGDAGKDVPFEVVFEDSYLLVVDKPAGVVTHPAPGHEAGTLAQGLAGRAAGGDDPWRPGSSTASTATRPGCSWWRSRMRCTGRSRS